MFENLLKTNIGRYKIFNQLTIKEYFMLGITSKNLYELLKMDLYKNMLNGVSKSMEINYQLEFDCAPYIECDGFLLENNHSVDYINMKQQSISPLILLTSNSPYSDLNVNNKWIYKYDNYVYHVHNYDHKKNKIIKLNMAQIVNIYDDMLTNEYYKNTIRLMTKYKLTGIAPKYEYISIQDYMNKELMFVIFDKSYVPIVKGLLDNFNDKPLFTRIVFAIYDFFLKLSTKFDNSPYRFGDSIIFFGNSLVLDINDDNINVFMTSFHVGISTSSNITEYSDNAYIKKYIDLVIKYIKNSLDTDFQKEIINELIYEFSIIIFSLWNHL